MKKLTWTLAAKGRVAFGVGMCAIALSKLIQPHAYPADSPGYWLMVSGAFLLFGLFVAFTGLARAAGKKWG
jgi:hypothetical protein